MTQINAYLKFNGNCREAMAFYKNCFGGELTLQTVGNSPMAEFMPHEAPDTILHSSLISNSITLFASELTEPEGISHGNAVYLCVDSENKEEVKTFFEKLSVEAKFISPLQDTPWGAFGVITDRFGFGWYLNYEVKTKA